MGIMQTLRDRLEAGATVVELEAEGFKRSSIYSAQRSLQPKPNGRLQKRPKPSINPTTHNLPQSANEANDPVVAELRRELAMVKLQNQLAKAKGEDKRLDQLLERLERLEEWTVDMSVNTMHCIAALRDDLPDDPDEIDTWAKYGTKLPTG